MWWIILPMYSPSLFITKGKVSQKCLSGNKHPSQHFFKKYWSDNQVSCTITFKPTEADIIHVVLEYFKYDLKSISFLPKLESGAYAQMPYEAITKEKFLELNASIKYIQINQLKEDSEMEKYCDNSACLIK